MGYTEINEARHKPPYWIKNYPNVVHCTNCGAVYSKDTQWCRVRDLSTGTQSPRYAFISDCKPNCCPVCEK